VRMFRLIAVSVCVAMLPVLAACEPGPQPIAYGEDTCDQCVMGISDTRFGSEIVTATGKIHRFDSVECLASFAMEMDQANIHSIWVTDFNQPEVLVRATEAVFLAGGELNSPMGMSLLAFPSREQSEPIRTTFGGDLIEWPELLERVNANAALHGGHAHRSGDEAFVATTDRPSEPIE